MIKLLKTSPPNQTIVDIFQAIKIALNKNAIFLSSTRWRCCPEHFFPVQFIFLHANLYYIILYSSTEYFTKLHYPTKLYNILKGLS